MNPNVNLHIESIVLDGIDLAPGQCQLLQHAVTSQLSEMLTQHGIGSNSFVASCNDETRRDNSIRLSGSADAMSLCPQLANAIYANIPQSQLGSRSTHGGQP